MYKPFSYRPFWRLATTCREEIPRPLTSLLLAGLPTEVVRRAVDWVQDNVVDGLLEGVTIPRIAWRL